MSRVVVKPYSTGTSPVGMPPKIRDGQEKLLSLTPGFRSVAGARRMIRHLALVPVAGTHPKASPRIAAGHAGLGTRLPESGPTHRDHILRVAPIQIFQRPAMPAHRPGKRAMHDRDPIRLGHLDRSTHALAAVHKKTIIERHVPPAIRHLQDRPVL